MGANRLADAERERNLALQLRSTDAASQKAMAELLILKQAKADR
jgi:hypothetical protein